MGFNLGPVNNEVKKLQEQNESDWEYQRALNKASRERIEMLERKIERIKETLMPVLEYGAEIYNQGTPTIEMPADTIHRLNSAYKMLGG